jgi:pimeloyl-ACP methyl ester carboxylesterase
VYQQLDVDKVRSAGPSVLDSATELPRLWMELAALGWTWPLLRAAPRGDGHPVLVLPGFTAGDESTRILRRLLKYLGYRPLPWGLGRNTGSIDVQERLYHRFESLAAECDRPMSIVGQSLGGVFARALAHQHPARVRQVITLGSPFCASGPDSTAPLVTRLFEQLSGMRVSEARERVNGFDGAAPPVPSTAIYSKTDGVVHWSACVDRAGHQTENVEVPGSHTGMALNPLVLNVVADRLAQPHGAWQPFERTRGLRALIYPDPKS